jgi:hypothetical protein
MPIVPDDIMLAKAAVIEWSLRRVLQIHRADPDLSDLMHLDALTLNVERACQAPNPPSAVSPAATASPVPVRPPSLSAPCLRALNPVCGMSESPPRILSRTITISSPVSRP